MAGAPLGNTNASNARVCRDALRKVLAQYTNKDRKIEMGQAIYAIYEQLIELALDGGMDAIREIGNRMDGKPIQVQEIEVTHTARSVVGIFRAKLDDDTRLRKMLTVAGADNLIPVLEQLMIEDKRVIEHEPA